MSPSEQNTDIRICNNYHDSHRFFGDVYQLFISDLSLPLNRIRKSQETKVHEMAESIRIHGLLNPIIVRTTTQYAFEVVSGRTRFLACKYLRWRKIPCQVMHLNDKQAFEVSLVENIKRESLSPIEEAIAFKTFVEEKGWGSILDLSHKIGKSSSYITKRIGLLNLPTDVVNNIVNNVLSPSSAEELLPIKDSCRQSYLGDLIARRHLTVKDTRKIIKEDPFYCENSDMVDIRAELQSFNKAIVALKVAMNKITDIIEYDEFDINERADSPKEVKNINEQCEVFLIRELLLYHAKSLHNQIDSLLKAKKKYSKNVFRYRKMLND